MKGSEAEEYGKKTDCSPARRLGTTEPDKVRVTSLSQRSLREDGKRKVVVGALIADRRYRAVQRGRA